MKRIVIFLFIFSYSILLKAQTAAEWTQQKKTKIKYLTQQIAALQVYTGYLQKGYTIAKDGLNTIGSIKRGDINLHSTFFSSLSKVNPKVKSYSKAGEIIACQLSILKTYKASWKNIKASGRFSPQELDYIYSVFTNLLNGSVQTVNDLANLLTDDVYQMKDDERIARMDELLANIQDQNTFIKSFDREAKTLALSRVVEERDVKDIRSLYNLKKE